MYTDPISDMLTRIRNAQMVSKPFVDVPFSRVKMKIAEILRDEGYVDSCEIAEDPIRMVRVNLKYSDKGGRIRDLRRVSCPSRRVYKGKGELPKVLNGMGIAIVSTSQGIMTDSRAREVGVGGEIICEVY